LSSQQRFPVTGYDQADTRQQIHMLQALRLLTLMNNKLFSHCPDTVTSRLSVHMHLTSCEQTKKCSFIFTANCLNGRTDPQGLLISYRNLLRCSITIR